MLIAEIGNNHFGSLEKAKELIRAANDSGADLIKGQAFLAEDLIGKGSMQPEFYRLCAFTREQCCELIDYARGLGNDLFFSVFSQPGEFDEFLMVRWKQKWTKLAGSQTRARGGFLLDYDHENVVISVPKDCFWPTLSEVKRAAVLYVTDYLPQDPELSNIGVLSRILGRQAGYSDHSEGVENCINAARLHGATVIEKHFTLQKGMSFDGRVFRDTIHGATPKEFEALAKALETS